MRLQFTTSSGSQWGYDNVVTLNHVGPHTYELSTGGFRPDGTRVEPQKIRVVDVVDVQFVAAQNPPCPRCRTNVNVEIGPDSFICVRCGASFIP